MQKWIILTIACLVGFVEAEAQHYKTAAGLRIGNTAGVTVVQAINRRWTAEALLHNNFDSLTYLGAMARRHMSLMVFSRNANMYYGGGLHATLAGETMEGSGFGLDAIWGVEFTMFHINFSFDYKPQFDFGREDWFSNYVGVSARYVLVEASWKDRWQKSRKKRQRKRKNYKGR